MPQADRNEFGGWGKDDNQFVSVLIGDEYGHGDGDGDGDGFIHCQLKLTTSLPAW